MAAKGGISARNVESKHQGPDKLKFKSNEQLQLILGELAQKIQAAQQGSEGLRPLIINLSNNEVLQGKQGQADKNKLIAVLAELIKKYPARLLINLNGNQLKDVDMRPIFDACDENIQNVQELNLGNNNLEEKSATRCARLITPPAEQKQSAAKVKAASQDTSNKPKEELHTLLTPEGEVSDKETPGIKTPALQMLCLDNNPIRNAGAEEIFSALRTNNSLQELYLTGIKVTPSASGWMAFLKEAIRKNNSLQHLDLSGNEICTAERVDAINPIASWCSEIMTHNTALRVFNLSGCGYFPRYYLHALVNSMQGEQKAESTVGAPKRKVPIDISLDQITLANQESRIDFTGANRVYYAEIVSFLANHPEVTFQLDQSTIVLQSPTDRLILDATNNPLSEEQLKLLFQTSTDTFRNSVTNFPEHADFKKRKSAYSKVLEDFPFADKIDVMEGSSLAGMKSMEGSSLAGMKSEVEGLVKRLEAIEGNVPFQYSTLHAGAKAWLANCALFENRLLPQALSREIMAQQRQLIQTIPEKGVVAELQTVASVAPLDVSMLQQEGQEGVPNQAVESPVVFPPEGAPHSVSIEANAVSVSANQNAQQLNPESQMTPSVPAGSQSQPLSDAKSLNQSLAALKERGSPVITPKQKIPKPVSQAELTERNEAEYRELQELFSTLPEPPSSAQKEGKIDSEEVKSQPKDKTKKEPKEPVQVVLKH